MSAPKYITWRNGVDGKLAYATDTLVGRVQCIDIVQAPKKETWMWRVSEFVKYIAPRPWKTTPLHGWAATEKLAKAQLLHAVRTVLAASVIAMEKDEQKGSNIELEEE